MDVSVCVITKNERENLERCLKSFSGLGFELVVVDTGSSDDTIAMAKQYTEAVYTFAWCNDFAKAKNYAVSKAKNDVVFIVDSDEYLDGIDLEKIKGQYQAEPQTIGRIKIINQIDQNGEKREIEEYVSRIFHRRYYHFVGRIHEQLKAKNGSAAGKAVRLPAAVQHTGYLLTERERLQKADRNIALLEDELKKTGDEPYLLYQLGKAYYMKRAYSQAYESFLRAMEFDLDPRQEYVIDMVECSGYAMLNSGRAEEAMGYEALYDEFGNSADFQFLMGLIYMNNGAFEKAVAEFEKAAIQPAAKMQGVNGCLSYYNIGVIYECLGDKVRARHYYEKCGTYERAKLRLSQVLA